MVVCTGIYLGENHIGVNRGECTIEGERYTKEKDSKFEYVRSHSHILRAGKLEIHYGSYRPLV